MGFEVNDDNEPTPKNVPALFGAPAPVNGIGMGWDQPESIASWGSIVK
jgi:hypothetical protein